MKCISKGVILLPTEGRLAIY